MASPLRMNQATVRLLSREAASLSSSGGKEITAVRCRNYSTSASSSTSKLVAAKPSTATPQSSNNSKNILIPAHDGPTSPYMISSRALSSSTRLSAPQGSQASSTTSQSQSSSSSSPVTSSNTIKEPSPATQGLLGGIAKLMGYDTRTSAAIRTTSDYYDRCSERDEKEGTFWYDECGLPVSYQSWMQITNLHIWLLSVRFRSLPAPLGKTYIQEIVNHYFIHAESLMRGRYNIKQNRLIKGYMRDMLYQYHGANMGYDEGLVSGSDAILAAAVWRNLFGAGWGRMGGVKGKLNQDGKEIIDEQQQPNPKSEKVTTAEEALADLDPGSVPPPSPSPQGDQTTTEANSTQEAAVFSPQKVGNQAGGYHSGGSGLVEPLPRHEPDVLQGIEAKEARFAIDLERLVKWIRSEVKRMENIPDQNVMNGVGIDRATGISQPGSLTYFSRI